MAKNEADRVKDANDRKMREFFGFDHNNSGAKDNSDAMNKFFDFEVKKGVNRTNTYDDNRIKANEFFEHDIYNPGEIKDDEQIEEQELLKGMDLLEKYNRLYQNMKELDSLKNENKRLLGKLKQKDIIIERHESELKRYRSEAFLTPRFEGIRRYSKELVEILKSGNRVDSYRILEILDIDPRDSELVQAVSQQLEELEEYGMIKSEGRGWRWIG